MLITTAIIDEAGGEVVTIKNTGRVRIDVNGRSMDVHDGSIIRFPGSSLWHWYALPT